MPKYQSFADGRERVEFDRGRASGVRRQSCAPNERQPPPALIGVAVGQVQRSSAAPRSRLRRPRRRHFLSHATVGCEARGTPGRQRRDPARRRRWRRRVDEIGVRHGPRSVSAMIHQASLLKPLQRHHDRRPRSTRKLSQPGDGRARIGAQQRKNPVLGRPDPWRGVAVLAACPIRPACPPRHPRRSTGRSRRRPHRLSGPRCRPPRLGARHSTNRKMRERPTRRCREMRLRRSRPPPGQP